MRDVELQNRLQRAGMDAKQAAHVTVLLRDRVHPIAELAVIKARDHLEGLALFDAGVGFAGLDEFGYEFDGTAGLFKKIGKAVKKVAKTAVKVVKKVALPVVALVAAPVTGGASVAAYATLKSASIGKKASKRANAASIAQTNAMITGDPVPQNLSADIKRKKRVKVPPDVSRASDAVARGLVTSGTDATGPADIAALMASMVGGGGGGGMSSPAGQSILQDVAQEGIEATPEGPKALPSWAIPVGAGVGVLALILMMKKGR